MPNGNDNPKLNRRGLTDGEATATVLLTFGIAAVSVLGSYYWLLGRDGAEHNEPWVEALLVTFHWRVCGIGVHALFLPFFWVLTLVGVGWCIRHVMRRTRPIRQRLTGKE
jgi:hypothetical protein